MKIVTEYGNYDLPSDFALEIDRSNAFISEQSEKSVPIVLPLTSNNKRIVGIDPGAMSSKPRVEMNVVIIDGVNQYKAKQIIHSIDQEGISTTFYFYLSLFWLKIKGVKLRTILSGYSVTVDSFKSSFDPFINNDDYDLILFPVAVKLDGLEEYFIVNEYNTPVDIDGSDDVDVYAGMYPVLKGWEGRVIGEGEETTIVPAGYGITPFIKSHRLLKIVMSYFGYTMSDNILTNGPLKNLVWLNTVVDSCVTTLLQYADLVPDITVQEFMDVYRNHFGCEFYPDDVTSEVDVKFFQEEIVRTPSDDLTSSILKKRKISLLEKYSQIKLQPERNLEGSDCEVATLEKLLAKYPYVGVLNERDWADASIVVRYDCVLRAAQGRFYAVSGDIGSLVLKSIASVFFDYDKGDNLAYKTIEQKASSVPIVERNELLMPFIGNALHYHTSVKDVKDKSSNFSSMICFGKYGSVSIYVGRLITDVFIAYGSISNYDNNGIKDGDYSLQSWGEFGLFHKFYSQYDAVLRHAFLSITADTLLDEYHKVSLKDYLPIMIDHQPLLIEKIGYTLGRKSIKESVFRTLKLQEPYDISKEHSIPELMTDHTVPIYFWKFMSNVEEVAESLRHLFQSHCYTIWWTDQPPTPPLEKPTAEQYQESQGGEVYNYKACRARVQVGTPGNSTTGNRIVDCWYVVGLR